MVSNPQWDQVGDQPVLKLLNSLNVLARPFAGPPGIPEDRLAILREAFTQTCADPDFLAFAEKSGVPIDLTNGEEALEMVKGMVSLEPDLINIDTSTTPYILDIEWYLDLVIKDRFGFPIEDAQVTVKDNFNNTVFSGSSDVHGQISKIILTEKNYTGIAWNPTMQVEIHTPHTIKVVKNGYDTNNTIVNARFSGVEISNA